MPVTLRGCSRFYPSDFNRAKIVSLPTARRMLNELKKQDVLREIRPESGRCAAILVYAEFIYFAGNRVVY